MIKKYHLFLAFIFSMFCSAQQYKIDTLQYKGSEKNLINLVILADGYTKDEMNYFREDAQRFSAYFFDTEPFKQYSNYFNVYAIQTISKESGAIHPNDTKECPTDKTFDPETAPLRFNKIKRDEFTPKTNPSTIFGSRFDAWGIHRLVVPENTKLIKEVLASHIPNYTQVVVLVNSPYYGGSGGEFATATVNFKSNDIAVHELGHSFGELSDEYWAGNMYANENVNLTQNAADVPWKKWIGTNGVGVYSYGDKGSAANWFRPHEFCKMQYLVAPFCSVCQEVFVEKIHRLTNPILKTTPNHEESIAADSIKKFKVDLVKPSPNTLNVKWKLNNALIAENIDSIYINKGSLLNGTNELTVEVYDATELVRADQHAEHTYQAKWQITNTQNFELAKPRLTWGKKVETCYNGYQVLSVYNPQAGINYVWYADDKGSKVIATTTNFVLPRVTESTSYFVQAVQGTKKSELTEVKVEVFDQIPVVNKVKVKKTKEGKTIEVKDKPSSTITYLWYDENYELIYRSNKTDVHHFDKIKVVGPQLSLDKDSTLKTVYVQKVNTETTCSSEKLKITL